MTYITTTNSSNHPLGERMYSNEDRQQNWFEQRVIESDIFLINLVWPAGPPRSFELPATHGNQMAIFKRVFTLSQSVLHHWLVRFSENKGNDGRETSRILSRKLWRCPGVSRKRADEMQMRNHQYKWKFKLLGTNCKRTPPHPAPSPPALPKGGGIYRGRNYRLDLQRPPKNWF